MRLMPESTSGFWFVYEALWVHVCEEGFPIPKPVQVSASRLDVILASKVHSGTARIVDKTPCHERLEGSDPILILGPNEIFTNGHCCCDSDLKLAGVARYAWSEVKLARPLLAKCTQLQDLPSQLRREPEEDKDARILPESRDRSGTTACSHACMAHLTLPGHLLQQTAQNA